MTTRILAANDRSIQECADYLKKGELVAFPTETVYGLGANALSSSAVAKIFEAKGRPRFNPLITHVLTAEEAEGFGIMNEEARKLAHNFWPGPLTMILPRRAACDLSDLVTAGLETVAIRVPAHKVARQLIKACGLPLAAPSANVSGQVSPTSAAHVSASLQDKVGFILAAGPSQAGLESTVVDMSGDRALILRPGTITAADISAVLGYEVAIDDGDHDSPKSPGQLLKHYAPGIPVRLNAVDIKKGEALLAFGSVKFMGIEGGGAAGDMPPESCMNLSPEGDLYEAASNLFAMLRALDTPVHTGIAVMNIPDVGVGNAINDRLRRAARA
ncbi:MAG: threonylcarbamoyl-AMP synthase [Micavibrio sp.]|nr:threonylcarbamoyl-AMP synthase [Micavibrio sp.]